MEQSAPREGQTQPLSRAENELAIRNRIAQVFLTVPDEEMYATVLEILLEVLESPHGIFGFVSDDGDLVIPSLTRSIWRECEVPDKSIVFPSSTWSASVWGRALLERRPFYANRTFSVPHGHIPVTCFLTVPVVFRDQSIGLLSVGNRPGGYGDVHLNLLQSIADFISPILKARQQSARHQQEQRQAEEALRSSEARYRLIADHTSDSIWAMGPDLRFTYLSPSTERLFGYPLPEWDTLSWSQFVHPAHLDAVVRSFNDLRQKSGEESITNSIRVRRKDGRELWVEFTASPVRDEAEALVGFVGVTRDITERKRAEEALEKRMLALTQPLDTSENIVFEDLVNVEDIQRLLDQFSQATGVSSLITRPDGAPITKPSNFCRLCGEIIRRTEVGLAQCMHSDALIGQQCVQGPTIQRCLSAGLWMAGSGISVGGKHVANWLIGQVRDETQTDDELRAIAQKIGLDETVVLAAFHEVPTMTRAQFEAVARTLFFWANQLSTFAFQNVQQARFITERKQAETRLLAALEEKTALLQEVHHRVKNNLQIVLSLLNLQADRLNNPEVRQALNDTRNRIRSMALLHETLYSSGNLARISLPSYVRTLCTHLAQGLGFVAARVNLALDIDEVALPLDQAVPCGLIINELVTNALKHAFPGGREGKVQVTLRLAPNRQLTLSVADDGVGLPRGLSPEPAESLGLRLVSLLVGQLRGAMEIGAVGGATFTVKFALNDGP